MADTGFYLTVDSVRIIKSLVDAKDNADVTAIAALNKVGNKFLQRLSAEVAKTGVVSEEQVRDIVRVTPATKDKLVYSVEYGDSIQREGRRSRDSNEIEGGEFQPNDLVKIVTMDDDFDCQICRDKADDSPYLYSEIVSLPHHSGHGIQQAPGVQTHLLHPNCRCVLQHYQARDPMTGQFARRPTDFSVDVIGDQDRSIKEIAEELADEIAEQIGNSFNAR